MDKNNLYGSVISYKDEQLLDLIESMSTFCDDESVIAEWINKLSQIYKDGYRHSYSLISQKLQYDIFSSDNEEKKISLAENLKAVLKKYENTENVDCVRESVTKLYDHINLEISREVYLNKKISLLKKDLNVESILDYNDLNRLRDDVSVVKSKTLLMEKYNERLENFESKIDEKIRGNTISSITALTIFSAVVLAFSGGLTFSSGMLSSMNDASSFRLIFTVSLVGFILFNTIFALIYLIAKLTDKQIGTQCKYMTYDKNSNTCKSCGKGYCTKKYSTVSFLCKLLRKYLYVFVIDCILLLLMYADFIMWKYNGSLSFETLTIIALPIICATIITILISRIRASFQTKRIREMNKISIINDILYPSETAFSLALRRTKRFFVDKKPLHEEFLDYLNKKTDEVTSAKVDEILNDFVVKKDGEGALFQKYISYNEGKANAKCYKILLDEFIEYLNDLRAQKS